MKLFAKVLLGCFIILSLRTGAQQVSPVYHIVKTQETLYRISVQYGVTIDEIKRWNGLTSNAISVGQRLIVGYDDSQSESDAEEEVTPQEDNQNKGKGGEIYHVVKPQETLYRISVQYGVSVNDIKQWNKLSSNELTVGQRLIVGYQEGDQKAEEDPDALYNEVLSAGDKAFSQGQYEDAKKYYEQALEIKPNALYPRKKIEEIALKLDEKSDDDSYRDAILLGLDLLKKQDYEGAKKAFQAALSYKPGDAYSTRKLEEIEIKLSEVKEKSNENEEETEVNQEQEVTETEEEEEIQETEVSSEEDDGIYYQDYDINSENLYPESNYYYPSNYTLQYYYPGYPDEPEDINYPANTKEYPGNYYSNTSTYYP